MIRPVIPRPTSTHSRSMRTRGPAARGSDIERRSYDFRGATACSATACCRVTSASCSNATAKSSGYGILSVAAGEAHILNLCVDPGFRSHGYGERLLDECCFGRERRRCARSFLEVTAVERECAGSVQEERLLQGRQSPRPTTRREERRSLEDAAVLWQEADCADIPELNHVS